MGNDRRFSFLGVIGFMMDDAVKHKRDTNVGLCNVCAVQGNMMY